MSDRRTAEVWLYKGDDYARLAELRKVADAAQRVYEQAKEAGTLRGGDAGPKTEKDAYDAFVAEAAERATLVRIQALGRRQWRSLVDENPARRELRVLDDAKQEVVHDDDADYGVNTSTFPDKILTYRDPTREEMRTIVEPDFPTAAALTDWLDNLSGGEFDRLWVTAFYLNREPGIDPFVTTFSAISRESSATSE